MTNQNENNAVDHETGEIMKMEQDTMVVDNAELSADMFSPEQNSNVFFSSIVDDGERSTQVKIYNAVSESEHSLADHKGKVLEITDMIAHTIELEDQNTKEMVQVMRVVLIDKAGKSYQATSEGVVSSLQRIIGTVGQAPWTPALKMIVGEVTTRKGFKVMTIKLEA